MMIRYNEIYDMKTSSSGPSILAIHTPTGVGPYSKMKPAFDLFKRYKYCGCDITIVNGIRVMNPSTAYGVSQSTITVDPRDTYDPILFKGCHGEDLGAVLNSIYANASDVFTDNSLSKEVVNDLLTNYYYACLSDRSWKKGNMQTTLRIAGLHPMVYNVASQSPMHFTAVEASNGVANNTTGATTGTTALDVKTAGSATKTTGAMSLPPEYFTNPGSYSDTDTGVKGTPALAYSRQLFTNKLVSLGWMDTHARGFAGTTQNANLSSGQINTIGKIFMGVLMFPKAQKSYNMFRIIITHRFKFAGYRAVSEGNNTAVNLTTLKDSLGTTGYHDRLSDN